MVASEENAGSCFSFIIPVKRLDDALMVPTVLDKGAVLVVTGHQLVGQILRELLTAHGYISRTTGDWAEAQGLIADPPSSGISNWSHILLDAAVFLDQEKVIIEDLGGLGESNSPRVWLLTDLANVPSDLELFQWGFTGALTKPVHSRSLAVSLAGDLIGADTRSANGQTKGAFGFGLVNLASALPESHPSDQAPDQESGQGPRVLLVEDNPLNQRVAQEMLKGLGCRVEVARNGVVALEVLAAQESDPGFDLIFMDCQMPEMDGFEATRRIRQLPGPTSGIPIVAMTANVLRRDLDACLEAGMNDTVTKPINKNRLEATLAQWCSGVPTA
jgi:CheY-like chemotaxis protein